MVNLQFKNSLKLTSFFIASLTAFSGYKTNKECFSQIHNEKCEIYKIARTFLHIENGGCEVTHTVYTCTYINKISPTKKGCFNQIMISPAYIEVTRCSVAH